MNTNWDRFVLYSAKEILKSVSELRLLGFEVLVLVLVLVLDVVALFVEVFFVFIVRVLYDRVGNVGFWFCHNERELSEARREREREREGLGGEDLRAYRYFF
jgi:hypothetical protein